MTSDLKSATLSTLVYMCIFPPTASEAMVASKQPQKSDLKSATLNTLVSKCILPLTAILVASEAMATSKRPWRSHLTLELNSVTLITYVPMSLWPLCPSI